MPWKNKEAEKEYKRNYHQKMKLDQKYRGGRKKNFLKWRKKNKEIVNEINKKSINKNKQKIHSRYIVWDRGRTERLTESYMIKHLKKIGYNEPDIKRYPELIQTHRIIIKTKRLWKRSQTSLN